MCSISTPRSRVKTLTIPVTVSSTERVQVFVYSHRARRYYPQASPVNGQTTVVLGDRQHEAGRYRIVAVALFGEPTWEPRVYLPAGIHSNTLHVRRTGLD